MRRLEKQRCAYCGTELEGRLRCAHCAQPPHEPQPRRPRVRALPIFAATLYSALMATGISVLAIPSRVEVVIAPIVVLALGLVTTAAAALGPIVRRVRERASLRAVAAEVGDVRPDEVATVRGRIRVRAPERTGGTAAERLVSSVESRRFEIVDASGRAIVVDDDALDLGVAGPTELFDRLRLRHGDEVLASGRVRVLDEETTGGYRDPAARLALEGSVDVPVRVLLERRAR